MLDRLKIRSFKSIAGAALKFGRGNLFVGANGSGKFNLLEAIGVYSACLGRGIDAGILSSKGGRLSAPHIFKSSFKNRHIPSVIYLGRDHCRSGIPCVAAIAGELCAARLFFRIPC